MTDDDVPLKDMIIEALKICQDYDLLDLIFKLIISEIPTQSKITPNN